MTSKITRSANGQPCEMRIPNVCNFDPATTVLAHIRRGGIAGIGQKPSDLCSVYACSDCHDAIDRRSNTGAATASEMDRYILEGHLRTLIKLVSQGLITIN